MSVNAYAMFGTKVQICHNFESYFIVSGALPIKSDVIILHCCCSDCRTAVIARLRVMLLIRQHLRNDLYESPLVANLPPILADKLSSSHRSDHGTLLPKPRCAVRAATAGIPSKSRSAGLQPGIHSRAAVRTGLQSESRCPSESCLLLPAATTDCPHEDDVRDSASWWWD